MPGRLTRSLQSHHRGKECLFDNPGKMSSPVGEADRAMQSVSPILVALARRRNRAVPSYDLCGFDDLAALVVAAVGADRVGPPRLLAVRARLDLDECQREVGASPSLLRLGKLDLWQSHEVESLPDASPDAKNRWPGPCSVRCPAAWSAAPRRRGVRSPTCGQGGLPAA